MNAFNLIKHLAPMARHFASTDYDRAIERLCQELDFKVHHFNTNDDHNGWVLPPKYDVLSASIKQGENLIFDGAAHPLSVICHSSAFSGNVSGSELKRHCWYDHRDPNAIPYHFRQSYRPWERDWGFCMPKSVYDSIGNGVYRVNIEIEESRPELKVLDYFVRGKGAPEYIFCAHLDHPGMANDDLSGCAVAIELFKKISKFETNFSYRLLIVQEIIGSQYFLNRFGSEDMISGVFLEMLGVDVPLSVQQSFNGDSMVERCLSSVIRDSNYSVIHNEFRSLIGNDEIVFESHGVPMCSLLRWPYPEYHSSKDNIGIICEERLEEASQILANLVLRIDNNTHIRKNFKGLFCLANPKYDLYLDARQAAFGESAGSSLRQLMEYISLISDGAYLSDLCDKFGVNENEALSYLRRWESSGLLEITGDIVSES